MSYLLGIDVSTTGAKALLIDEQGTVLASHTTEYPLSTPQRLRSEQDPSHWWNGACASIRAVLSEANIAGEAVSAIGLTGQMHGLVMLDKSDHVLGRENQQAARERLVHDVVAFGARTGLRRPVLHELDADHQALAAHVTDDRVLLLQFAQAVDQVTADGGRIGDELLLQQPDDLVGRHVDQQSGGQGLADEVRTGAVELDADHQALAAHVADDRVLLLQLLQQVHHVGADVGGVLNQRRPQQVEVASAAAHATGLPPKVLACAPGGHDITSTHATVTPSGRPDATTLATVTMSGCMPKCSI